MVGTPPGAFAPAGFCPPYASARKSFAERSVNVAHVASPIRRKQALPDVSMKAAVRPIGNARHVAMLDRVEMDVIDVPGEICVAANGVLPIAPLPDPFFALGNFAR